MKGKTCRNENEFRASNLKTDVTKINKQHLKSQNLKCMNKWNQQRTEIKIKVKF